MRIKLSLYILLAAVVLILVYNIITVYTSIQEETVSRYTRNALFSIKSFGASFSADIDEAKREAELLAKTIPAGEFDLMSPIVHSPDIVDGVFYFDRATNKLYKAKENGSIPKDAFSAIVKTASAGGKGEIFFLHLPNAKLPQLTRIFLAKPVLSAETVSGIVIFSLNYECLARRFLTFRAANSDGKGYILADDGSVIFGENAGANLPSELPGLSDILSLPSGVGATDDILAVHTNIPLTGKQHWKLLLLVKKDMVLASITGTVQRLIIIFLAVLLIVSLLILLILRAEYFERLDRDELSSLGLFSMLAENLHRLTSRDSLPNLLDSLAHTAAGLPDAILCSIYFLSSLQEMEIVSSRTSRSDIPEFALSRLTSILNRDSVGEYLMHFKKDFETSSLFDIIEGEARGKEESDYLQRRTGANSILVHPIKSGEDTIGVMLLAFSSPPGPGIKEVIFELANLTSFLTTQISQLGAKQPPEGELLKNLSGVGILLLSPQGRIQFASEGAARITGIEQGKLVGKAYSSLVSPEDKMTGKGFADICSDARETGMLTLVQNIYNESGRFTPQIVSMTHLIKDDKPAGYIVSLTPVPEELLKEHKAAGLAQSIVDYANVIIYALDTQGKLVLWNRYGEFLTGFKKEELEKKDLLEMITGSDEEKEKLKSLLSDSLGKSFVSSESPIKTKDGVQVILSWNHSQVKNQEGEVAGIFGIGIDITKQRMLETRLANYVDNLERMVEERSDEILTYKNRLDSIIQNAPLGILLLDRTGNVILANQTSRTIFGTEIEELENQNLFDAIPSLKHPNVRYALKKVLKGDSFTFDGVFENEEHRRVTIRLFFTPITDQSGDVENILAILEDVSLQESLQQQLLQSQKMESIGTLAGGISHDFNNVLEGILGYTSLIKTIAPENSEIYSYVNLIEQAAKQASVVTQQLLSISYGGSYSLKPTDINSLVKESAEFLRHTFPKSLEIKTEFSSEQLLASVDSSQLQQAIMNICINARDAMEGKGKLTVSTSRFKADASFAAKLVEAYEGEFVRLDIEDTGPGIPDDIINKIFEPFFTTKEKGKGTGLGLSTTYRIVKNHSGFITVDSEVGKGTLFSIFLPIISVEGFAKKKKGKKSLPKGKETILVVDDEEIVRRVTCDLLKKLGYKPIPADSGDEALNIYREKKDKIDLVILDMLMPGLSGVDTFEQLKKIKPDVPVVFSTGYNQGIDYETLKEEGALDFLPKPFMIDRLATAMRKTLDKLKKK